MYCVSFALVLVLSVANLCDTQKVYPIVSGWYQDRRVSYYDFGASSAQSGGYVTAIPIYVFIRGFKGTDPIPVPGQFNVVSKKPGMMGYSDLWSVHYVNVSATYVPNSIRDEATIKATYPNLLVANELRNCPIVENGSRLEGGELNLTKGWYNNEEVVYFDFGPDSPSAIPIWVPVDKYNVHHGNNLINSVPGNSGYSHFWKVSIIDVPVDMNDNHIRSFSKVTELGYPVATKDIVVNCPVVKVDPVNSFYFTVGWYKGRKSYYYDFGARSPLVGSKVNAIPIYVIGTNDTGVFTPVPGQMNIISFNLSDGAAYSDLWQVHDVVVPSNYVANTFKSEEQALTGLKVTKTDILVNCPVVPDGSVLRDGGPTITLGWYKGVQVSYFDFGPDPAQPIPIWPFIRPDGLQAGNNVIDSIPGDVGYSAFWDVRKVDVPLAYTNNLVRSASQIAANSLTVTKINVVVNCPVIRTDSANVYYLVNGWYKQRKVLYWDLGPSGLPKSDAGELLTNDIFIFYTPQNQIITTRPPVFRYPRSSSSYSDICKVYKVYVGSSFVAPITSVSNITQNFPEQNITDTLTTYNSPIVAENSILEGTPGVPVPTLNMGYSDGTPVWYFLFGPADPAIPIWAMFNPAGLHVGNNVIDSIPGDPGYSDIWRVRKVSTTSIYTSSDVLRSQEEIANSGFAVTILDLFVNCPFYTADPEVPANYYVRGWFKDRRSYYYDFGARSAVAADNSTVVAIPIYAFITGRDAQGNPIFVPGQNNVISKNVGDAGYSDLWQVTFVQVPATYVANTIKSEAAILSQYSASLTQGPLVNCPIVASAAHVLANGAGNVAGVNPNIVKGWYKDQPVFYFDFGRSPSFSIPIWLFVPVNSGKTVGRFLIDKVPSDAGYSAFWRVHIVTVPPTFMPDSIRSYAALQASGYPIAVQNVIVNCPVVYTDSNLVVLDSNTSLPTPTPTPVPTGPLVDPDLAAKGFKSAVTLVPGKVSLSFKTNAGSIDFALRSYGGITGYVAVAWPKPGFTADGGNLMDGADAVFGTINDQGQATVAPFMLFIRGARPSTTLTISATSGDLKDGVQTFYFTRVYATGSNPLTDKGPNPTIWAYHQTSDTMIYHSDRASSLLNLDYASFVPIPTSPTPSPTPATPVTPPAPSSGSVDADLAAKGYKFAVVFASGKVSLSFKPNTGSVDFVLRSYGGISGYVAVGWPKPGAKAEASELMNGADAVFGTINAEGQATVAPYTLFNRGANPSTTLTISATSGDLKDGVQTFYFTRAFATGANPLTDKGPNPTIWAYHQNSDSMIYHSDKSSSLSLIDYVTGGSSTTARSIGIREVHAILMILSWGLLLLFGALFARFAKTLPDALWFQVHQYLQPIGFIVSIIGVIIGLVMVQGAHFTPNNVAHAVLGIVITVLGVIQVLAGIFRPHKEEGVSEQRPIRQAFEIAHPGNGYLLCILAIVQIFLGIKLIDWPLGAYVGYGIYVGLTLIFFIVASFSGLGKPQQPTTTS